jgi:hypothetical protein
MEVSRECSLGASEEETSAVGVRGLCDFRAHLSEVTVTSPCYPFLEEGGVSVGIGMPSEHSYERVRPGIQIHGAHPLTWHKAPSASRLVQARMTNPPVPS